MSTEADSVDHELNSEDYLKDISNYMRLVAAILQDSYNSDITIDTIEKLEDCNDGTAR